MRMWGKRLTGRTSDEGRDQAEMKGEVEGGQKGLEGDHGGVAGEGKELRRNPPGSG